MPDNNKKYFKENYDIRNIFTYTLFSILISFFFIFCLDSIFRDIIGFYNNFNNIIHRWLIIIIFAGNIMESIARNILKRKNSYLSAYIRINTFIYLPIIGLYTIILYRNPVFIFYPIIIIIIQSYINYNIFRAFSEYDSLNNTIHGKSGNELYIHLRNVCDFVENSFQSLKRLKGTIIKLLILIFLLVFTLILLNIKISIINVFACLIFIFSGSILFLFINTYLDEHRFLGDGLASKKKLKQKRFTNSIIIILFCFIFIFLLAGNISIFSPVDIVNFLNWIFSLFPSSNNNNDYSTIVNPEFLNEFNSYIDNVKETYGNTPVLIDIGAIISLMAKFLVALLIIYFIYFLLKPLFKQDIRKKIKSKHPLKIFIKKLKYLFLFFRQLFKDIFITLKGLFGTSGEKNENINIDPLISHPLLKKKSLSKKKKKELNRVVRAFILLIKWGEKQNIHFQTHFGPKEYIKLISNKIPNKTNKLIFIADTFEEAVFSNHTLGISQLNLYLISIKSIFKT